MKLFFTAGLLLAATVVAGQQANNQQPDTTIRFSVAGACDMCKLRIEKAATIKGVSAAHWDETLQQLTLTYQPAKASLQKIQKRILDKGHDVENQKASDDAYNVLPGCCLYRGINEHNIDKLTQQLHDDDAADGNNPHPVKGIVMQSSKKGAFTPLAGATVAWLGSNAATITDTSGLFSIAPSANTNKLLISYAGLQPDTLTITDFHTLKIVLAEGEKLEEVVVTARQRTAFVASLNATRMQVMTERELFKAACCNLSESFETNPSVDVSYNDAITGSKQIQLLGLSGIYTQLTVENMPGPRGLATTLGLNSIAGPWIESIQLTKGTGSVANGYESIAGQINVELKKPDKSESLYANAYINEFGKTDLNLNLAKKLNDKWSTLLLLHDDFNSNPNVDFNKDGFRDLPTGNQFGLVNRWRYDNNKGIILQMGIHFLKDSKTGGETIFNPDKDKLTQNSYGLGINTTRTEGFVKLGYIFPAKKYQSIGLQLSAIHHRQDAYFGLTTYDGRQQNFYGNLIYQSIIGNTNHKFRTGISFLQDNYREHFNSTNFRRNETVPGAFFEYTYTYGTALTVVAGIRSDYHNLFGWFATPRLNIKYQPVQGTTIHISAGRGQRTANIFAENTGIFASSRQLQIIGAATGKAYGLNAEVAWNQGITIDQKFQLFGNDALISLDYFRTSFTNQVVADMENPRQIAFYNLQGKSYSNSLQAELHASVIKGLDVRMAYRYFDVKTTYSTQLLQRPLIAPHRAFANLAYAIGNWKLDYTFNYIGNKRIPSTTANPAPHILPAQSPAYTLMAAQITKSFGKKTPMDIYLGAENIGNFFQQEAILAADEPFGPHFDAALVWGPLSGRMFYVGWRMKIK
ncbi:MAG TPA: carboxypeptidase-like regulatory domain-containing protein [Ferruginibacter sp.]|nr:carboxypeptidase-like regulatory domain-containing protein [Ferruginibacter sp.]HMP20914.1 carboxypeptidase-like regulatory domain-containing protein [Ferruginibacter sp.]